MQTKIQFKLDQFFLDRRKFHTNVLEGIQTNIKFINFFLPKFASFIRYCRKTWQSKQTTVDNTVHAFCMLDTQRYKRTLRLCNTFLYFVDGAIQYNFKKMTNLVHTCSILQYFFYNTLHVSSLRCSSSGVSIVCCINKFNLLMISI